MSSRFVGRALLAVLLAAACGTAENSESAVDASIPTTGDLDAGISSPWSPNIVTPISDAATDGTLAPGVDAAAIAITPQNPTLVVTIGQPLPTLTFQASYAGQPLTVKWSADRGEVGAVDQGTGIYTPTGALGGRVKISAFYRGVEVSTMLTVKLVVTQNGDPNGVAPGTPVDGGAGGFGGVGGEGPGLGVDAVKAAVLQGTTSTLADLGWLYPYDKTVWPRGMLAPLLQWEVPSGHTLDAVRIRLSETNFEYDGLFAAPALPLARHPVPQRIWEQLAASNEGDAVTLTVTLSEGTAAYALPAQTWTIAAGSLKGTTYYNSYGTRLVTNYWSQFGDFGGATLSIKGGAKAPGLAVGSNGQGGEGCRVCHSVAANGSTLVTNRFVPSDTSSVVVDLKTGTSTDLSPSDGRFSWGALSPDGTLLFSNAARLQGANPGLQSALYTLPQGAAVFTTGIPQGLRAGTPVFSPDGRHVAFNLTGLTGGPPVDGKSLAVMDFDPLTKAFSNYRVVFTPGTAGVPDGIVWFPTFLPTSNAVVFHLETQGNGGSEVAETRARCQDPQSGDGCSEEGVRAELWWVELATNKAARLDSLNGVGYVPPHPTAAFTRSDGTVGGADYATVDSVLNYEPTIVPVPSGGYAWVVFTSRRRYGNVATMNPYHSDPRTFDLAAEPTTKKLWVAAIDLNAAPGTDPSHPAFYLPAQELYAGNARAYSVLDPCKSDGDGCETGIDCCGGFCRQGDGGTLVCSPPPPNTCAHEFESCSTDAECCNGEGTECIGGRCAQSHPVVPRVK